MPKRVIALGFGLLGFLAIVLSIAAWAAFSGDAGVQRGLVIRNVTERDAVVTLENGQSAQIPPNRQFTFVIRREDFPSTITATSPEGAPLFGREFAYEYFVRADFRVSFDERGFFPTSAVREPPAATPVQEVSP